MENLNNKITIATLEYVTELIQEYTKEAKAKGMDPRELKLKDFNDSIEGILYSLTTNQN